ncbi:MAG: DUF3276 family protein [Saprospiraceae bacterium]|nr:DUF3276 family protein [Saprospiraceae bacterium]
MENDGKRKFESVYSNKVKAGKRRTYFFDVRMTKGNDYYITLTESTKKFNSSGYERHKIFLYKEDFNRFLSGLEDVISHVKTELMPDFDYEQYERREEEWEAKQKLEQENAESIQPPAAAEEKSETNDSEEGDTSESIDSEEDMTW